MAKQDSDSTTSTHNYKKHKGMPLLSPKLSLYVLAIFVTIFILFRIQSLQIQPSSSWDFMYQQRNLIFTDATSTASRHANCSSELKPMVSKLRDSVTFLPLKDIRYSNKPLEGHTWFMSSTLDIHKKGDVQHQEYPSQASKGRILCLKGKDTHDGSWNSYALVWPQALPFNATLMKGVTFVSYNHYNYDNIWHGMTAVVPFISWHIKQNCSMSPDRWILYHWGELRTKMGPWLSLLMTTTFGEALNVEKFDGGTESGAFCFEKAVVMRHHEGGMSREKRMEVYDLMRCKARVYCNVSRTKEVNEKGLPVIGMTMFMRTGARSFKNETKVVGIFNAACQKVEGCRLTVAYANNLTFCEQVKLMSSTDILVSPHGAQLTNMFFMDRNSSVMEFFPKGWLKLAGVGQFVYHWIASWSGMNHRGAWRDTSGDTCPFPEDDRRCMSIYKMGRIGHNESYFSEWAKNALHDHVKLQKSQDTFKKPGILDTSTCLCKAS